MTTRLSECDYNYLIPPKEVFDVVHSEHYIRHGEGKKSIRKIFACDKYYDDEMKKLKEFEALIAKENVQLPSDWTTVDTIRFMYAGKLDLKKSLKVMKQHLEWRQLPERGELNPEARKLLEEGYVYIAGRDKQFRPVIIVNGYRVDLKIIKLEDFLQALCFVLDTVRKFYFIPGKVENWIIFIENNNEGVFNFPLKVIKSINDVTSVNYTSTLDKLYIVNPSSFLKRSWMFISNFIDPETATKIQMLGKSDYARLLQQIDPDQLEVKYGGTLPDQQIHWPPVNTLGKPPHNYQEPKSPISATYEKVLIAGDQPSHGGSRIVVIEPTEEEIKGIQDQPVESNVVRNKSQDNSPGIVEPAHKKQEEQQQLVEKRASGGIHHENFATFGNAGTKNEDSSLQPLSEVRFTNVDGGSSTTRFREPETQKDAVEQGGFSGNVPVENKKARNVNTVNNAIFEHDDEEIKAVREENVNIGLLEGYDTQRNSRAANMTFGGEVNDTSQMQSAKLKGEVNAGHIVVERESVKVGGFCGMCKQSNSNSGASGGEQNNCNIF
jgi:hypothetical protein